MIALRAVGAEEIPSDKVEQPFFEAKGQVIQVHGQDVQVLGFADENHRKVASELISPDRSSISTTMVTWVGRPHFWARGELIVLYVSSNEDIIRLLSRIFGLEVTN